jgi:hypothetical protein
MLSVISNLGVCCDARYKLNPKALQGPTVFLEVEHLQQCLGRARVFSALIPDVGLAYP